VESVLRYGLPPIFMSAVIKPAPKNFKSLKKTLDQNYDYLGGAFDKGGSKKNRKAFDIEGEFAALMLDPDYTPYVWFHIPWQ
jgi:V-type H+-transporting ATPase subunit C